MVSTTVLVSKQGILGQASMTNLWIGKVKQKKKTLPSKELIPRTKMFYEEFFIVTTALASIPIRCVLFTNYITYTLGSTQFLTHY
jgi:hypothetical protein